MLLEMIAATDEVMTTRLTSGLFFFMDLRTPRVPFTAGTKSSCGSSASKWKGEAMWRTASTFLTASSNALSFPSAHVLRSVGELTCPISSTMT